MVIGYKHLDMNTQKRLLNIRRDIEFEFKIEIISLCSNPRKGKNCDFS